MVKYWNYVGRDERSTEGYRNTKLVLELRSGVLNHYIEYVIVYFEP